MPDPLAYGMVLGEEACSFIVSLSKSRQRAILDALRRLARHPFGLSDFKSVDASGRQLENLRMDKWLVTFWVDHAVKEVRVVDVMGL